MRHFAGVVLSVSLIAAGTLAHAGTLSVGPGKTYAKPCQAFAAAQDGDVIEIDAAGNGTYDGDVCPVAKSNLTIRGVNGRAHVDAAGQASGKKAIWVVQGNDTTIENVELSGCQISKNDGYNGAGIRQEGKNLTVRGCYFHDNQDGILESNVAGSEIFIETTEFAHNGAGDGQSHNMYIGTCARFTLRYSYSHHSNVGHLVKTRADENYILYNRIADEADGTGSYEIDIPVKGTSYVVGNVIQQGPQTQNSAILTYGEETAAAHQNPGTDLYVVNNTFVDQRPTPGLAVRVSSPTPAIIKNNIFYGGSTVTDQASATLANNYTGADPKFADLVNFHLAAGSPCINAAADPGSANGFSLLPPFQYVPTASFEARPVVGVLDIGAFEFGQGVPVDAGAPGADATASPAADAQAVVVAEDAGAQAGADASRPDGAVISSDAGKGAEQAQCGCSTTSSGTGMLALGLLALVARRRRRA